MKIAGYNCYDYTAVAVTVDHPYSYMICMDTSVKIFSEIQFKTNSRHTNVNEYTFVKWIEKGDYNTPVDEERKTGSPPLLSKIY